MNSGKFKNAKHENTTNTMAIDVLVGNKKDNDGGKIDYSCKPPSGKTYVTIGQDFFSIQEYVMSQYNASLHRHQYNHIRKSNISSSSAAAADILPLTYFHPASTMSYTDIYQLKGLNEPADYGSGIEYARGKLCKVVCGGLRDFSQKFSLSIFRLFFYC